MSDRQKKNKWEVKWLERKIVAIKKEILYYQDRLAFAERDLKQHQKWLIEELAELDEEGMEGGNDDSQ